MPNNFGGDQYDPEYAPHLYDEAGKFVGDKTKDKLATSVNKDPRVRAEVGDYRVVAPSGRAKDGRFFVNGSLVIEKRDNNALGEARWSHVATLAKPGIDCKDESEIALYRLLAGPGAE